VKGACEMRCLVVMGCSADVVGQRGEDGSQ
jgi:hypothetical protein